MREFSDQGQIIDHRVGPLDDPAAQPQVVIPAGAWFAAWPAQQAAQQAAWSLVGCTVAPGFDFADFLLATADDLSAWPADTWQHLVRRSSQ